MNQAVALLGNELAATGELQFLPRHHLSFFSIRLSPFVLRRALAALGRVPIYGPTEGKQFNDRRNRALSYCLQGRDNAQNGEFTYVRAMYAWYQCKLHDT